MAYQKLQPTRGTAVTPSNTANIAYVGGDGNTNYWPCVLYVGTGGSVKVLTEANDEITFANVPNGTFLPVQVVRVFSTGTTASNIVALW
jgi:hypothetical protein